MLKWILLAIGILIGWFYVKAWFVQRFIKVNLHASRMSCYYGAPGVGKSTWAAYLADRYIRSGITVYSNLPINGCYRITADDLGKYLIEDCLILWDEVGVDFNSRNFKSNFTKEQIRFWKYHRHENAEVAIFSQGFDDMDKILRVLCTDMFVIRRSILPYLIVAKPIRKRPNIDENTHQPIDYYDFVKFGASRILAPLSWKMFNSFERLGLPPHDFPLWNTAGREPTAAEHIPEGNTFENWTEFINLPTTEDLDEEIEVDIENL